MVDPIKTIVDSLATIFESPLGTCVVHFHYMVILNLVGCEVCHEVEIVPIEGFDVMPFMAMGWMNP